MGLPLQAVGSHLRGVARYTGGMDAPEKRRWYRPTPGWLVLGSLAATGLIWLSNWLGWPAWHKGYAVLVAVAVVGVTAILTVYWIVIALNFGWRFQFGIRTLLVLVVAVALPCSWLAVETRKTGEQRDLVRRIRKLQGQVSYDWEHALEQFPPPGAQPPGAAWLRALLGDDFFASVEAIRNPEGTDASLAHLDICTRLRMLDLGASNVTDAVPATT